MFSLDRFLALLLLVILFPLLVIILIIIFLDLRCNPIFKQERTVNGRHVFFVYKFRSMKPMAPNVPTAEIKKPHIYLTNCSKFIRTYSLDELPNIINILIGDMKFIGPRPIMLGEIELIRLRIKNGINNYPGITGLAQINGRDFVTMEKKVACEKYYNRKNSWKLRIYILFTTIKMVVRKVGVSH